MLLFSLFFYLFGLSALDKFQENKVMVVKEGKVVEGISSPVITVCGKNNKKGWKVTPSISIDPECKGDFCIQDYCNEDADIGRCVKDKTYNRTELVRDAALGYYTQSSLMKDSLWTEDFTVTKFGKCYSLDINKTIGTDSDKYQIFLYLSKDHNYDMYVHDRNYFAINENNNGIPNLYQQVSDKPYYYQFNLVEHHDLNLPGSPCNEDAKYNFQV